MLGAIFFGLISYFSPNFLQTSEWKKELEKEGIVIYTRKVADSPFQEFLAETKMTGTISEFKKVFSDVENYTTWMPDCETVSLLAQVTENEFSYQMNLKVPFPVSDRETIQTVRFVEKPGELTVILTSCFDCIPENKGVIRIEKSYGTWIVRQVNPTEISLRFQYFTDPGGGVPAWLVNAFIVKSPHKTLINLRELLADDKN